MERKTNRSRKLAVWLMVWTFMVLGAATGKAESNHLDQNEYMKVRYDEKEGKVVLMYDICRIRTQSSWSLPSYIMYLKIHVVIDNSTTYCYLINKVGEGDYGGSRSFSVTNQVFDQDQYGMWVTQHKDGWSDPQKKNRQSLSLNSYADDKGWKTETHWYIPQRFMGKTVKIIYEYHYDYAYKESLTKEGREPILGKKTFEVNLTSPVHNLSLNATEDLAQNRIKLNWNINNFNSDRAVDGTGRFIVEKQITGDSKWTVLQKESSFTNKDAQGEILIPLNKFSKDELNKGFKLRVVRERKPYHETHTMPIFYATSNATSEYRYPTINKLETGNLLDGSVQCKLILASKANTRTTFEVQRATKADFSDKESIGNITIESGENTGQLIDKIKDRSKGFISYYYRAKPQEFGQWETLFSIKSHIPFNTNYAFPESFRFENKGNTSVQVSWDAVTDGIWEEGFKYKLTMTSSSGVTPVYSGNKATTSLSIDQLEMCTPLTFEIAVVKGEGHMETAVGKHTFEKIVLQDNTIAPAIEYFKASKGVTADAVKLEWKVKEDEYANNFKRFILTRRPLSGSNENTSMSQSEVIGRFDYETGNYLYTYRDPDPDPGIYYEYVIAGQVECNGVVSTIATSIISSVGFKQPYGVVSGNILYTDKMTPAVGVSILAEGTSSILNRSMEFKQEAWTQVRIPYKPILVPRNGFTFQAWIKFKDFATATTKNQTIIFANNLYALDFSTENKQYRFFVIKGAYENRKSYVIEFDADKLDKDTFDFTDFHHVTVVNNYATESVILYINGKEVGSAKITDGCYSPEEDPANVYINLGRWFDSASILNGYMDEVRLWDYSLTEDDIKKNYDRYLSGKEYGLVAYYRFDEFFGEDVYDYSGSGSNYNENHAKIMGSATRNTTEVPTSEQLSIKGVTDDYGNYQITTVPYTKDGSDYRLIPLLGGHSFTPPQKSLFFSPNSPVHNNIDFVDNSSFIVSGYVYYAGGDYPVEGCSFLVDGKTVTDMYGTPILSGANGYYEIPIPIGQHEIKVEKTGHVFANNGRALQNGINPVISNPCSFNFTDSTRVKVVGRVVGGKVEEAKPLGFGESKNNIGATTIKLVAKKNYDLFDGDTTIVREHNNGEWKKENLVMQDVTNMNIHGSEIEITVSEETGEFVVDLYPEAYLIQEITYGKDKNNFLLEAMEELDLTHSAVDDTSMMQQSIRTWVDSVDVPASGSQPAYRKAVTRSDTVYYHATWSYIHQAYPSFSVQQLDGSTPLYYFGDENFTRANPITGEKLELTLVSKVNGEAKYEFDLPVFSQSNTYKFKFSAYEKYVNDIKDITDEVKVSTGEIRISNDLALEDRRPTIQLDSIGEATYSFYVGAPELVEGVKSFSAVLYIDNIPYNWTMKDPSLSAYVLGAKSTGTDFVTAGPDEITAVVHDPPGSNSYSYLEKGTSFTKTSDISITGGQSVDASVLLDVGTKTITWTGIGAGVILESEIVAEVETGVTESTTYKNTTQTEKVTTFTERFQTKDDPLYVGHSGDVFIANSTNIQYGETNAITILHRDELETATNERISEFIEGSDYVIGKSKGLAFGLTFDTRFAYTEMEIIETNIPKWKNLIHSLLKNEEPDPTALEAPYYRSKYSKSDSLYFGKSNMDPIFGNQTRRSAYEGPSYEIIFPVGYLESEEMDSFVDSIQYCHDQINLWEKALAENERRKVEMDVIGNYSFGAGSQIEYSQSTTNSYTTSSEFTFLLSPKVTGKIGGTVLGIGMTVNTSSTINIGTESSSSSGASETKTVGFVLSEEGLTDQISVDYGWTEAGMIAFKTRGGRTSCPYEPEVRTQYYEPGVHVLSESTMQVDVPDISVKGGNTRLRVPSHRPASFTLELKNLSEIGWDNYYVLMVDDTTNPHGAVIKIDGLPIGNGRTFLLPANEIVEKTLTIEKGPDQNLYEDIRIILAAECQQQSLFEDVFLSAEFLPSCSDISFAFPRENWIVNSETGDTLDIVLEGYDVNYNNFTYVDLQYKESSASTWISLQKFFLKETGSYQPGDILIEESDTNIRYRWNMSQELDGRYELRARTVCETEDGYLLSEMITPSIAGVKDNVKLQLFGKPQPANGILTGTNDLMIRFNKDINEGMVSERNFTITGVKNGSSDNHFTSVHFDGVAGNVTMEQEINLANKSFTVEFWLKREALGASTVFSHGTQNESFSIGFTEANKLQVTVGNTVLTSEEAITNTSEWGHYAIVYDHTKTTISAYYAAGSYGSVLFTGKQAAAYNGMGVIKVGSSLTNTNHLAGNMHGLRLWDRALTQSKVSKDRNVRLPGNTLGLIGYWMMDEGKGTLLQDKSANRHGAMNASWKILPEGHALSFNGRDAYLTINTGATVVIDEEQDFSIEMWFKGSTANGTLFSSGRGDGNDNSTGGKLSIYFENGTLKMASKGFVHDITSTNYLDNKWHHFALAVNRAGSANVYVDGELQTYMDGMEIGSLANSEMHIGMRRWNGTSSDLPFNGVIDEFRIWNLALTQDYISRNNNVRLLGGEVGLIAYYPFDTYIVNNNQNKELAFSLSDQVNEANTPVAISTNAVEVAEIAPVKDAGPVENYQFKYVTNKDQIVLNLTESSDLIERTYITITAKGIQDLNGNGMKSPVSWSAYIDRSFLHWEESELQKTKKNGESLTFDVKIAKLGGYEENYTIENIPSWLTITPSSGTIQPGTTQTLQFKVDDGLNPGIYEEQIHLKGEYSHTLLFTLNVGGEKPDWSVDPGKYETSMSMIGQLKINDVISKDENDLVAAFINGECVGVTSPLYNKGYDVWQVMLNIYYSTNDAPIEFRIWDASTGKTYANVLPSNISFVPNTLHGSALNPVIFATTNSMLQTIDLKAGWNWVSFNMTSSVFNDVNKLFAGIKNGVELKGQASGAFSRYDNELGGWLNSDLGGSGVNTTQMYLVKMDGNNKLQISGTPLNPAQTSIHLATGWNWISFIPQSNMGVGEAFAGFTPSEGDIVKSMTGFAVYDSNLGWVGSLSYMMPGVGYMYKAGSAKSFTYPERSSLSTKASFDWETPVAEEHIGESSPYEHNLSLIAEVDYGTELPAAAELVTRLNGTITHTTPLVEVDGKQLFFATIPGEESDDMISFSLQVYNEEFPLREKLGFDKNAVYGSLGRPQTLTLLANNTLVYPNPFSSRLTVEVDTPETNTITLSMYNLMGVLVYQSNHNAVPGLNHIQLDRSKLDSLIEGVYVLQVKTGERIDSFKLIKNR
ncbi:T9SS type A sorting domain-containing protein [Parabacteroides sp. OttesenSCG-928-J18]|nr:T9SS type A sorting domain-containing protein [Parabacteroides sp. OttesenSCG-928-J18]